MGLPWDEGWTIPFDAPYYPPPPVIYRNVEFQYVFFEADPGAVARLLPAPLEASPDGACMAMGIRVPFSSGYGAFSEALVQVRCSLRGEMGWYCSHVWHDGPRGIAAGREIWGTPKIFAELDVRNVEGGYLSRASVGGAPILTISSTHDRPADAAELPAMDPNWRLKMIPRADGPGPALKQLVDGAPATSDLAGPPRAGRPRHGRVPRRRRSAISRLSGRARTARRSTSRPPTRRATAGSRSTTWPKRPRPRPTPGRAAR